jgi:hypothetical protein
MDAGCAESDIAFSRYEIHSDRGSPFTIRAPAGAARTGLGAKFRVCPRGTPREYSAKSLRSRRLAPEAPMSAASRTAVRPLTPRARRLAAGAALAGLLGFGALFVAFVPGCGGASPDYYCDSTGCYSCDAFGCSTVTPPAATKCARAGDLACVAPQVCTDQGCAAPCTSDASCDQGLVCKDGYCAAPTSTPPKALVCTLASDCGAGFDCVDGTCVAAPACTHAGCSCKYSSECGTGRVCADGLCADACNASTPCAAGYTCSDKGICVLDATPKCGAAANGVACPSGQHCVDGQCATGCSDAAPCLGADGKADPQQQCVAGACVPNPHPATNCNGNAQCSSTQQCIDGFCKYTCTSNTQCMSIDSRIPNCASDGVCRSDADVNAKCTAQSDCASGKSCVDGTCR